MSSIRAQQRPNWWGTRAVIIAAASVAAVALASCERGAHDAQRAPQLMTFAQPADSLSPQIAARQRQLVAALAATDEDVSGLVSRNFTLFDAANPGNVARDVAGRSAYGQDYFRLLNRNFPPGFATISQLHVLPEYRGTVVVITRHPGIPATITAWEHRAGEWQAVRMTINAPEEKVERATAWYSDAARNPRR